jgi:class 3 adenylate cyclase/TolB-like protein/Flp pilus assembly protein TadD
MSSTRQLAAIMFTDISGYTALMGNDEQKAFDLLKKNRELQKPIIEKFNGRWIKELGDGVMASFNTVSDAVNAAIKIQEACNAAKDFQLSIGIHQGEIIFENDDIYGDAVNIASRIQSLGVPGSVLFSKKITDEIRNKSEFQLTSLGIFEFKNVEEPIEVFALSNPGFVVPKPEDMRGKLKTIPKQKSKKGILITAVTAVLVLSSLIIFKNSFLPGKAVAGAIKSLAILPFENIQKDSTLFFLSDGIPENLINRMAAFSDVKVFARSATFGLADTSRSIASLRKLLNADVVLTGRLMKIADGYSLSCELVDASNQSQMWGHTYDLVAKDLSKIEDSIITSLLNPLKIALIGNSNELQQTKQVNPEAYAEYLKGRYLSYGSTPEESEKALSHFREAIRIDPKYAVAYAAIANEKIVQGLFSTASKNEIVNEVRTALEAAKALDPELADIYTSEGALKFYYDWDWEGAIASYKKALELDPGNATIYIRYSTTLADLGRYKEALPLADKAVELDPVSISSLHNLGWVNLLAGNYKKSTEAFGKALELHPTWVWGHIKKALGHISLKEYDKALFHAESAEQLFKDGWGSELLQTQLGFIYKNCDQKEKADTVINRFLKYAGENTVKDPFTLSYIYYLKGDNKKANEWEEKTMEGKFPSAYLMSIAKIYDKEYFQSEAHQNILKKMGFVK